MKFYGVVKDVESGRLMVETYDKDHVKTIKSATKFMSEAVSYWNSTLRPHESPREFIKASLKPVDDNTLKLLENPPYKKPVQLKFRFMTCSKKAS